MPSWILIHTHSVMAFIIALSQLGMIKLVVLFGLIGVLIPILISLFQYLRNKEELKRIKEGILMSHKVEIDTHLKQGVKKNE
ncbi:MAG: hypothetical protein ACK5B4_01820 [Bacteroidota bacterium]|jgi:hypothetical protein